MTENLICMSIWKYEMFWSPNITLQSWHVDCHLQGAICQLSPVGCHLPFVICHSSVSCELSVGNCHLSCVNCQVVNNFQAASVCKNKRYIAFQNEVLLKLKWFFKYLSDNCARTNIPYISYFQLSLFSVDKTKLIRLSLDKNGNTVHDQIYVCWRWAPIPPHMEGTVLVFFFLFLWGTFLWEIPDDFDVSRSIYFMYCNVYVFTDYIYPRK